MHDDGFEDDDNPYAPPSAQGARRPRRPPRTTDVEPHRASVVLVLGVLGLAICFICGIFAWVMGTTDLAKMRAGTMDPAGRSETHIGWILGIVSTLLGVLAIIVFLFVVVLATTR